MVSANKANTNDFHGGYVLFEGPQTQDQLPTNWAKYFSKQTLKSAQLSDHTAFRIVVSGLPQNVPPTLSNTLLEQLAWGLLARPNCQIIVQPLYVSIKTKQPTTITQCYLSQFEHIINSGFIAIMRYQTFKIYSDSTSSKTLKSAVAANLPIYVVSRSLLEENKIPGPAPGMLCSLAHQLKRCLRMPRPLTNWLKTHLSIEQKEWIRNQLVRCRNILTKPHIRQPLNDISLAKKKKWGPIFQYPEVALDVPKHEKRIPVLMAIHWLELGGAEKFVVDLIKALPKDKYAIYVTTDVPSENPWRKDIINDVEEIFHLPEFLQPHMAHIFYEYYIRTRGIRLLHIHHAPLAYNSLFHIRRFHPNLKVLDTLHILELPPHSGGFPESTARNFEAFIDKHHVISKQLQNFLVQRWRILPEKVHVIYLNVDINYFDPDKVEYGRIRSKYSIPETAFLIGFIGRLTRQKRPLVFVEMAKLLIQRWKHTNQKTQLHFIMAGSGLLQEEVQKAIANSNLRDNVHLHGEITDIRPIYKDCDLLVMPSENEGLALVAYEAMSMKLPVFFTDVGAQSELLKPEFLVPDEDPIAPKMVQAVWPFLLDKERRVRTGEEFRSFILEHHQAGLTFTKILELYQQLLENTTE